MKLIRFILLLLFAFAASCGSGHVLRDRYLDALDAVDRNDLNDLSRALEGTNAARHRYLERWTLLHLAARWDLEKTSRHCFGTSLPEARGMFPERQDNRLTAETAAAIMSLIAERGGDAAAINDDGDTPLHVLLFSLQRDTPDIPSIPPVRGRIASSYGWRGSPFDNNSDYHRGIDISAKNGTTVRAAADGIVEDTVISDGLGNCIVMRHKCGHRSVYGHCHLFNVRKGSSVSRGAIIGYVGRTGASTGDHCHYEVRFNGAPVDPAGFINLKALHDAQLTVLTALAEKLLALKAPVNARNRDGRTPLVEAAGKSLALSRLLLDNGADVNICDDNGVTPLHVAAAMGPEMVRLLIERGARVNSRTRNIRTSIAGIICRPAISPLGVAMAASNSSAADLLKLHGASE